MAPINSALSADSALKDAFTLLRSQYLEGKPYTSFNNVVVAINPKLLSEEHIKNANDFWPDFVDVILRASAHQKKQFLAVTGESGAGKTEVAKLILQELGRRGTLGNADADLSTGRLSTVNALMESFGHAATRRNANSSRFGKLLKLEVIPSGCIRSVSVVHYLLETSRLVSVPSNESNFHVFHGIVNSLQAPSWNGSLTNISIPQPKALCKSRYIALAQTDASKDTWDELQEAFMVLGFSSNQVHQVLCMLVGILALGGLAFQSEQLVAQQESFELLCQVLGFNTEARKNRLSFSLLWKSTVVKGETYVSQRSAKESVRFADGISKMIYSNLFSWLVHVMNGMLTGGTEDNCTAVAVAELSLLDLFGFESFSQNGFEQFCINMANERLHSFFCQAVLRNEHEEYQRQGIPVPKLKLSAAGQEAMDLIFSKSHGIVSILETSCRLQTCTDSMFFNEVSTTLKDHNAFFVGRKEGDFVVRHYCQDVCYSTRHFLDKNRDVLPDQVQDLLEESDNQFVREMLHRPTATVAARRRSSSDMSDRRPSRRFRRRGSQKGVKPKTVCHGFTKSLDRLLQEMSESENTFVRCIRPDVPTGGQSFDHDSVSRQIRTSGLVELMALRKQGYAHRTKPEQFIRRFPQLCAHARADGQSLSACRAVLETHCNGQANDWRMGKSLVLFRDSVEQQLSKVDTAYAKASSVLQAAARGRLGRHHFEEIKHLAALTARGAQRLCSEITGSAERAFKLQLTLADEDARRPNEASYMPALRGAESKEKSRRSAIKWWKKEEKPKGHYLDAEGQVFIWFHGMIDRDQAEDTLFQQRDGTFLVRISERSHGYVLSFVRTNRIIHLRIIIEHGVYGISGSDVSFPGLHKLINFYLDHPIHPAGSHGTASKAPLLRFPMRRKQDLKHLGIEAEPTSKLLTHATNPYASLVSGSDVGRGRLPSESEHSQISFSYAEDELEGEIIPESHYLEPGEQPFWLRKAITRTAAEKELLGRGACEGSFVIREKMRATSRVVMALSVAHLGSVQHHLLEKRVGENWTINEEPVPAGGTLNNAVRYLQTHRHPQLPVMLQPDPPPRRTTASAGPFGQSGGTNQTPRNRELPAPPLYEARKLRHESETKPMETWSIDEVVQWLNGLGLVRYTGVFRNNNVNGASLCQMTNQELSRFVHDTSDLVLLRSKLIPLISGIGAHSAYETPFGSSSTDDTPREPHVYYTRRYPLLACKEDKLHRAARKGNMKKIQQLASMHPSLNVDAIRRDGDWKTPLFVAVENGHTEAAKILLELGANPFKRNRAGARPLDAALLAGHVKLASMLRGAEDASLLTLKRRQTLPVKEH